MRHTPCAPGDFHAKPATIVFAADFGDSSKRRTAKVGLIRILPKLFEFLGLMDFLDSCFWFNLTNIQSPLTPDQCTLYIAQYRQFIKKKISFTK